MANDLQILLDAARAAQADAKDARRKLKSAAPDAEALKLDVSENVYPFFEKQARLMQKLVTYVAGLDEAVAALESGDESLVTPELAEHISAALGAGQALAAELARVAGGFDELNKKRVDEALKAHQRACDVAWQMVLDAMGEEVEDDEGEGEDGADGEGEDQDQIDTVELPAVQAAEPADEVTNG